MRISSIGIVLSKILSPILIISNARRSDNQQKKVFRAFLTVKVGRIVFEQYVIKMSSLHRVVELELANLMHSLQLKFRSIFITLQMLL
jgi:hypothetical protein